MRKRPTRWQSRERKNGRRTVRIDQRGSPRSMGTTGAPSNNHGGAIRHEHEMLRHVHEQQRFTKGVKRGSHRNKDGGDTAEETPRAAREEIAPADFGGSASTPLHKLRRPEKARR